MLVCEMLSVLESLPIQGSTRAIRSDGERNNAYHGGQLSVAVSEQESIWCCTVKIYYDKVRFWERGN